VDCTATELTVTVAWADPAVKFVDRTPTADGEMDIRLAMPGGRTIHRHAAHVLRTVGAGHVAFTVVDPPPGNWLVRVETADGTHVRFTVGGFVHSPLELALQAPSMVRVGQDIALDALLTEGGEPIKDARLSGWVTQPAMGLDKVRERYMRQMGSADGITLRSDTELPDGIAQLTKLREKAVRDGGIDPLGHVREELPFHVPRASQQSSDSLDSLPALPPSHMTGNAFRLSRGAAPRTSLATPFARLIEATEIGSTNVVVSASGTAPRAGCRFVRKQLVSVRVRQAGERA
jgi:hypothetical protein